MSIEEIKLTKDQIYAFEKMKNGSNLFITGAAGTGKSTLINEFRKYTRKKGSIIALTSTTGISALNIGGKTIHSWAGILLGKDPIDKIISGMSSLAKNRWLSTDILIIDEISMLNPDIFDLLNEIGKRIRSKFDDTGLRSKPFGGIQVIVTGDFFQLPVVKCDKLCFNAKTWSETISETIELKEIVRQQDPLFINVLKKIRKGIVDDSVKEVLTSRLTDKDIVVNGIKPSILHSKNIKVNEINILELNKLIKNGAETHVYKTKVTIKYNRNKLDISKFLDEPVPEVITLAVGAQIIFKKNIDNEIANGTMGYVTSFEHDTDIFGKELDNIIPVITLTNGSKRRIRPFPFEYKTDEYFFIKEQLPLKLGWSISIHASQGSTVDLLEVNINDDIFEFGQAYVAISRSRTLDGLYIRSLDFDKFIANPAVIDYFE